MFILHDYRIAYLQFLLQIDFEVLQLLNSLINSSLQELKNKDEHPSRHIPDYDSNLCQS